MQLNATFDLIENPLENAIGELREENFRKVKSIGKYYYIRILLY